MTARGPVSSRWAATAASAVLTIGVIIWAAAPLSSASGGARLALVVAAVAGGFSLFQVVLARIRPAESGLESFLERQGLRIIAAVKAVPWPELMIIAVLTLEALHPSRPWHTAVLGVAVLADLLSLHLAETGANATTLRRQAPLLAAGIGLCALAVGAAAIPSLPTGTVPSVIRVVAVAAAVIACGLAIPAWRGHD